MARRLGWWGRVDWNFGRVDWRQTGMAAAAMDECEQLFDRGFLAYLPSLTVGDSTIPLEASGLGGQATGVGLSSDNYKWGMMDWSCGRVDWLQTGRIAALAVAMV